MKRISTARICASGFIELPAEARCRSAMWRLPRSGEPSQPCADPCRRGLCFIIRRARPASTGRACRAPNRHFAGSAMSGSGPSPRSPRRKRGRHDAENPASSRGVVAPRVVNDIPARQTFGHRRRAAQCPQLEIAMRRGRSWLAAGKSYALLAALNLMVRSTRQSFIWPVPARRGEDEMLLGLTLLG